MNVGVAKNAQTGVIVFYDVDDPADFQKALAIIAGKRPQDKPMTEEELLKKADEDAARNADTTLLVLHASFISTLSIDMRQKTYETVYLKEEQRALTYNYNGEPRTSPYINIVRARISEIIGDDYITPCAIRKLNEKHN